MPDDTALDRARDLAALAISSCGFIQPDLLEAMLGPEGTTGRAPLENVVIAGPSGCDCGGPVA